MNQNPSTIAKLIGNLKHNQKLRSSQGLWQAKTIATKNKALKWNVVPYVRGVENWWILFFSGGVEVQIAG